MKKIILLVKYNCQHFVQINLKKYKKGPWAFKYSSLLFGLKFVLLPILLHVVENHSMRSL